MVNLFSLWVPHMVAFLENLGRKDFVAYGCACCCDIWLFLLQSRLRINGRVSVFFWLAHTSCACSLATLTSSGGFIGIGAGVLRTTMAKTSSDDCARSIDEHVKVVIITEFSSNFLLKCCIRGVRTWHDSHGFALRVPCLSNFSSLHRFLKVVIIVVLAHLSNPFCMDWIRQRRHSLFSFEVDLLTDALIAKTCLTA